MTVLLTVFANLRKSNPFKNKAFITVFKGRRLHQNTKPPTVPGWRFFLAR